MLKIYPNYGMNLKAQPVQGSHWDQVKLQACI